MTEVIDVEATDMVTLTDYIPEIRRTPEQVKASIESLEALLRDHMRDKIDYGTIPGTPKPSLYKAGAERLARFFGLGARVEQIRATERWPEEEADKGFLLYTYRVGIGPITPNGVVPIAWCEGSANSRERKFAKVPIYDAANTLQKMAQKRAYVGAVLMATNTSDFFSQDLEDLPPELINKHAPIPTPMAGAEPEDIIMPWGKHKGESLGDIRQNAEGYLAWLKKALAEKEQKGDLPDDQLPLRDAVNALLEGE